MPGVGEAAIHLPTVFFGGFGGCGGLGRELPVEGDLDDGEPGVEHRVLLAEEREDRGAGRRERRRDEDVDGV